MGSGTPSAPVQAGGRLFGSSPGKGEPGILARQALVVSIDVNTL